MSQHGWCFVEDKKDDSRRGWVPGISCHFHLAYFNLECFFTRNKCMQCHAALDVLPRIVKFVPHTSERELSPLSPSFTQSHTLGNFITVNGREPFMKGGGADEDELWSEANNNERSRSIDLSSWLSAISEFGRASETSNSSPVESNTNRKVPHLAVEETEVLGGAATARSLLTRTRCSW